jgi:hypothetical protein
MSADTEDRPGRSGDGELPARPRALLSVRGVIVCACLLIVVQLMLKATYLRHGYFRQDDFEYVARAVEHTGVRDYLLRMQAGQFMPGGFGLVWLLVKLHAYSWGLTAVTTILLQAAASLALLRLLRQMFGTRPAILAPMLVYAVTPMTLAVTVWWAAALNALPLQIALPMALHAHIRNVRGDGFRHAVHAAGWTVFGLAFYLKAGTIPLLLFALTSAYLVGAPWWAALRRYAGAWLLYGSVLLAYAGIYLAQMHTTTVQPREASAEVIGTFARRLLGQTLPVTAVGGPQTWMSVGTLDYAVAAPSIGLVVGAWTVIAAVIGLSVWLRRRALRAWSILFAYVVVTDVVPVALGRVNEQFADLLGMESRYVAEAAPLLAICLGLAFLPLVGEADPYRRTLPESWQATPLIAGMCLAAFAMHSVWSGQAYTQTVRADRVRAYMGNARESLDQVPAAIQIYERQVPDWVQSGLAGEYAKTSRVLAPLASEHIRWKMRNPQPARDPLTFDDQGLLVPMDVADLATWAPPGHRDTGCWKMTGGTGTATLSRSLSAATYVARFDYIAAASGHQAEVRLGSGLPTTLTLDKGVNLVYFPVAGPAQTATIRVLTPGASLCPTRLRIGTAIPRP